MIQNNTPLLTLVILHALCFSACNYSKDTFVCGDITYIDKFPTEIALEPEHPYMQDLEGAVDIISADSLLLMRNFKTPFLSVYSIKDKTKLGSFLKKGQGPGEIAVSPSNFSTFNNDGDIILRFSDNRSDKYYNLDLNKTLSEGHEVYDTIISISKIHNLSWIYPLTTDTIYWYFDFASNGYKRKLSHDGVVSSPAIVNDPVDLTGLDINTVGFIPAVNLPEMTVAEAMIRLNQINLYSLTDSTFRRTICVGDHLDILAEEDNRGAGKRKNAYKANHSYGNYFVCLYIGQKESYVRRGISTGELQFFTPVGDPLLRIRIPFPVNTFMISPDGILYLFSFEDETEKLYRYDIPEIKALHNK